MSGQTGVPTGTSELPPIGTAEILARDDDSTDFGLPEDYVDPNEYHGKTPPCDRIIGVTRF